MIADNEKVTMDNEKIVTVDNEKMVSPGQCSLLYPDTAFLKLDEEMIKANEIAVHCRLHESKTSAR